MAGLMGLPLTACSGPALLNGFDRLSNGDQVERLAEGVPFGTNPRQRADVWSLPRNAGETRPVLVFFYGGGWTAGRRQDYAFAARAYAAKGFVVVLPDYRLVPEVVFPAFLEDGAAAIRWARDTIERYGGDPARMTLAGHSAGAYAAVMLALDPTYLKAAGVDPGIVRGAAGLAGPYDFYPFTGMAVAAMERAPDPMATQPIHFARADAPPLWLATGSEDTLVRPRNSVRLAERIKEVGGRATLRIFDGLDHSELVMALSRPFRDKGPVLDESADFLMSVSR